MLSESASCHRTALGIGLLLACCLIGVGLFSVTGWAFVYGEPEIEDVKISTNETQKIEGVNFDGDDYPITIEVGELVERGASFDENTSSYQINGDPVDDSEIKLRDQDNKNASIVIKPDALPKDGTFDLKISQIDTTGFSNKNQESDNDEITYRLVREELDPDRFIRGEFEVNSRSNVELKTDAYDRRFDLIELTKVRLENNETDHVVVWQTDESGKLKEKLGSTKSPGERTVVNVSSLQGETSVVASIHPSNNGSIRKDVIYASDKKTITVPPKGELDTRSTSAKPPDPNSTRSIHNLSLAPSNKSTVTKSDIQAFSIKYDSNFSTKGGSLATITPDSIEMLLSNDTDSINALEEYPAIIGLQRDKISIDFSGSEGDPRIYPDQKIDVTYQNVTNAGTDGLYGVKFFIIRRSK